MSGDESGYVPPDHRTTAEFAVPAPGGGRSPAGGTRADDPIEISPLPDYPAQRDDAPAGPPAGQSAEPPAEPPATVVDDRVVAPAGATPTVTDLRIERAGDPTRTAPPGPPAAVEQPAPGAPRLPPLPLTPPGGVPAATPQPGPGAPPPPPPAGAPQGGGSSRRRTLVLALVAAALVIVAGVAAALLLGGGEDEDKAGARAPALRPSSAAPSGPATGAPGTEPGAVPGSAPGSAPGGEPSAAPGSPPAPQPSAAASAPPIGPLVQGDGVTYQLVEQDDGYYEGRITFTNTTGKPLKTWRLAFRAPGGTVTNVWGGRLAKGGGDAVIESAPGAAPVPAGAEWEVRYGVAGPPARPQGCRLDGRACGF
ncbi:cellulose binding domain-containing protein [Actinomadura parmotrematis]|uniref:Cellulose binding domain-containing protein n=1 Tax=Actinomadura parmotrematis TaxID=2864039 RepID=A0ABS7G0T7_9ACTN|nr:cellulose binding domain-containing protein [Actinomadura parmotrematis]MBW8486101.1 cellulose binding domain-containing protein [Actinomadura parmotrematis]